MIQTSRLHLRPLTTDDAAVMTEAVAESLPQLLPWMGWAHPAYDIDDSEAWMGYAREMWSLGREFQFGVFAGSTYLGGCGIDQVDWRLRSANLGYWIRTSEVGHGYAAEAGRAVVEWAFRMHTLFRIEIVVMAGNDASERTAARIGALREGVARNRLTLRGSPRDATVYSLIPSRSPPEP